MAERRRDKWILAAILVLGAFARLWRFGAVPCGLNQDEAFAAYEAWALLTSGVDSSLRAWPVYLTAWGSGMNALETYLLIPLLAVFGVHTWVVRLPQVLISLLSVWAAYRLGRRIGGGRAGLLFALLLAVCPWHIAAGRWALESNLAPGLLLFGLCCFLRGMEQPRFYLLSALFYGLSLYAYSAIWPVTPLLLLALLLYARPKRSRELLVSALLLAALALPLLLFLAVNYGLIGEFSLGPFSVPKLLVMRAWELSLRRIPRNARNLFKLLLGRSDGLVWNTPTPFGLFYPISLPFALLGLGSLFVRFVRSLKGRRFDAAVPLLLWTLAGLALGLLISANANRVNILLLPLVLCAAHGLETLLTHAGRFARAGFAACAAVYLCFFAFFAVSYFGPYAESLRGAFTDGVGEAVEAAVSHEGTVYATSAIHYPKLLLYARVPPRDFASTAEYEDWPAAYLNARSFTRFRLYEDAEMPLDPEGVYILWAGTDLTPWETLGFTAERHGVFNVLWRA
ncbi:MAG: glycosyltransferase family 39 protein [Oscillospiraceae bacterium]|nr:glycosyltransferase family 39 protein [Oscillospiraceae bacterium]